MSKVVIITTGGTIAMLRGYEDRTLRQDLGDDKEQIMALVKKYFYCG